MNSKYSDIAVIGMAGRFPGAQNVSQFWENICQGRESVRRLSDDELKAAGVSDKKINDKSYVKVAPTIEHIDKFDASFFKVSPAEAQLLDPQLRLLLQCAWETLEDAGVATSDAQNIGVFTGAGGVTTNYFSHFINQNTNFEKITAGPAHLGNDKDFLSTYISYKLNLTGPSITVQTACSTSLVALHQACLSLRNGDCDMAMAGGVTIRVPHIEGYHHKEGHIVSSSGHVKTFDESADGTIFGSGLGLVLVKKLADAVADGNHIYAVIKGSAITNDGKAKLSYAASSARGQIRCITTALDNANVDPGTIGFVETHGTGTYMGDPEEVKALTSAFKKQTDAKGFCAVGAVKTNVGHLEAAAGITGFIKAVLSLHHGFIPPTINFEKPNPRIKFEKTPFYVNSALQQWPSVDGPRRAAVNSLGVGGTNAFVILEQYQASEAEQEKLVQAKPIKGQSYIIPLSAKTKAALVGSAQRLADYIDKSIAARPWQKRQLDIAQLAYTMQMGRAEMDHKMAIVADDLEQLRDHLLAYIDGETSLPQHIVVPRDEETQEQQALFGIDDDVIAVMKQWLADKHWSQLALAWVEEHELEWQWLHEQQARPQLASLPTYYFAKDRHWVESGQIALGQSYLHPLLHVGSSDLSQQSYNSNFDGSEFFLVDHQINPDNSYPRKVLPGVGYIEMARSAIEEALPPHLLSKKVMFHHIVWLQPMEAEQALDVTIALFTEEDEEQIEFEVYSLFEEQNGEQQILIHCQGQATLIEQPMIENFDLEQFKKQMQGPVYQTGELYPALAHMGLNYGPSFQGLKTVWVGDDELLAEIELPPEALGYSSEFVLHPTMLDSALQATNVLAIDVENPPEQPLLPFALEEVNIYAKPRTRMFAWVKYSEGHGAQEKVLKLDISLMDKYGNLCVSMNGFTARVAVSDQQQDAEITGSLFATPVWQPSDIGRADENQPIAEIAQHHLMVCDLPKVDMTQLEAQFPQAISQSWQPKVEQNLAQNYSEFALQFFNYIKQTLVAKPEGNQFVQLVLPYRKNDNIYAGVFSLLKSAKLENPKLIGQVVLVDEQLDTATLAQQLAKAKARTDNFLVKCEQGIWEVLDWQALPASLDNPPTFNPAKSAYNDYGIYLITGGLGGLGRLFAEEILTQTSQAKVILTGRSSSEKIASNESAQSHLNALGPRASYQALDLANADEVNQFIQKLVAQEGRLNGIIHSAGMNHDNFIVNKTEQEFLQVLAPKVQGTYNLDHASREVDLDFMVLFSSLTSAIGNLGQTDYAAANGFMDQFAMFRNNQVNNGERRGRTLAINWSLWAEGGMGQDEEAKKILRQTTGIEPMRTETGMLTFYRSLALNLEQTVIMEGDLEKIQHTILDLESDDAASGSASPEQAFVENLVEKTEAYLCKQLADLLKMPAYQIDPAAQMDKYGINSIMAIDLTNLLEQSFGRLSKTLFFEYQTISELASYFINSHAAQLSGILAQQPALSGAGEAGADDNHAADVVAEQSSHAASSSKNVHAISLNGHSKGRRSRGQRLAPNRSLPAPRVATQAADIAIIGLSGRYPQAQNISEYWQKLRDGVDCITEVPHERWDWHEYFSADRTVEGHHFSKWGGFIDGVDLFDSRFFNISPREAETIDPQERLFLEHAWMAIEDAGITRDGLQIPFEKNLPGQVGVYAGVMYGEYQLLGVEASNRGQRMGFASNLASIANRVSFVLNVHGPSMTIDTMCSSSLTAIHVACQDLKQGHTSLALAGGVNVTVHPNKYLMLSSGQFISSDGHCQSFGEGGDGYIPAEGVGVVVLKRLDEAEADNHHIYGIIRGTSLSHGGRTNGYTVPNPQAQAAAISRALIESNIDPRHISYVEAHGTGTKLGDPIEIAALNKAFYQHDFPSSKAVKATGFCDIGSAKSNIGHAESAAGIAGLTKILLQMKYGKVVPSLHSARLNPHIDFDDSPFVVNQELKDWSRPVIEGRNIPRIAGLSSFGAGGSNAHMIIEEYQPLQHPEIYKVGEVIVVLSARTLDQLREQAKQLLHFVRTEQHLPNLVDLAYTLQVGREAMGERMAIVASSIEILEQKLQAVIESSEAKGLDKELHLEDVYIDQVKANRKSVSLISQDEDMVEAIDKWIRRSKLAKLSELWVKGMPLEWLKLYREQKPQLISLPTYPFAKTRCWVEIPTVESQAKMGAERIHPLLHRNESNLHQYGFGSRFSGEELFFSAGRLGVGAYVEMARAAIDHVTDDKDASIELFQLAFGESYAASQSREEKEQREQQDVAIALMPSGSNGHTQIGFEIYSDDTVHAQGKARFVSSTALIAVDLAQLTAKVAKDPSQLCTTVSVAAQLQNSADFAEDVKQYQIIPQLLDTALTQALNLDARLGQTPLPVSLKSLQIYYPCKTAMTAWARPSVSGAELEYDIDLINDFGHICVSLKGLRYELKAVAQPQAEPQTKSVSEPISEVVAKPVAAVSKPQAVATAVQAPVTPSIRKLALDLSNVNLSVNLSANLSASTETPSEDIALSPLAKPSDIVLVEPASLERTEQLKDEPILAKGTINLVAPLDTPKVFGTKTVIADVVPSAPSDNLSKPIFSLTAPALLPDAVKNQSLLAKPVFALAAVDANRSVSNQTQPQAPASLDVATIKRRIELLDKGNGLFSILLNHDVLDIEMIVALSAALKQLKAESQLNVVTIESQSGLSANRGQSDFAITYGLYAQLADFAQTIVVMIEGDLTGGGFMLALLADFMVLNANATIELAQTNPSEVRLLTERFGQVLAYHLLYIANKQSAAWLAQQGLNVDVVDKAEVNRTGYQLVDHFVSKSAQNGNKPNRALSLLKRHLMLDSKAHVDELVAAEPIVDNKNEVGNDKPEITSPAKHIELNWQGDVAHVHIGVAKGRYGIKALLSHLQSVLTQLSSSRCRAIVLSSDYQQFLPQASSYPKTDILVAYRELILDCQIPVVVALTQGADSVSWPIALVADGCIYSNQGHYQVDHWWVDETHAKTCAVIFQHRLSERVAKALLLANQRHSGLSLMAEQPALLSFEADKVLSQALDLAAHWSRFNDSQLLAFKRQQSELVKQKLTAVNWQLGANDFEPVAAKTALPLDSQVISATIDSDGVVVITMADKEAKNMFSDAFTAGMNQVFAHIAQSKQAKVVVMTGFDNYFAAGGNKDMLLAIQKGEVKFTDNKIFEVATKCPLPVIAAMQGHGIGAGWVLGMNAEISILAEQSQYFSPYMNYGFTPGAGSTYVFRQKVGLDLTRRSLMTGFELNGSRWQALGLMQPVLPRKEVLTTAIQMAQQIAKLERNVLIAAKALWNSGLAAQLDRTYELELEMHQQTFVGDAQTLAIIETNFGAQSESQTQPQSLLQPVAVPAAAVATAPVTPATTNKVATDLTTISAHLRELLAQELRLSSDEIDDDSEFVELGLDSITGVTWIRKINEHYHTNIEAIKVYSYPTLAQLSVFVRDEAQAQTQDTASPAMPEAQAEPVAQVQAEPVVQATPMVVEATTVASSNSDISFAQVNDQLKSLLADELRLDLDEIDQDSEFVDLGLDSITGVTWIRKINEIYGTDIEAIKVYSYPTLSQLTSFVLEQAQSNQVVTQQAPVQAPVQIAATPVAPTAAPRATEPQPKVETQAAVATVSVAQIEAQLRSLLADELRLEQDEIDSDVEFVDLGLDSITGVTWIRKINEIYGTDIEAIKVYSYPNLTQLSQFVQQEAGLPAVAAPVAPAVAAEASAPQVVSQPVATAPAGELVVNRLKSWRKTKLEHHSQQDVAEIAVIGMSGQFPMANDLNQYWQNIAQGKNCISEISEKRWSLADYYQQGTPVPGKTYSKWMGELDQFDLFDNEFFNITPKEAKTMDPQQRMFLQTCWAAIENAGFDPSSLSGSNCGVFAGCAVGDYHQFSQKHQLSALGFTGNESSMLAARISYYLNLVGPSMSINTACSSSLVAISNACDSLTQANCDIALAGGVNVMAGPGMLIKSAQAGMLSKDGRCFTFDQRANGFVAGEGVGAILLKRLTDAERDNDAIIGVIRGWGVNQDGKTNGITAPNADSQTALQQSVFGRFGINPEDIQLIEAHGTGTALGDPIEVAGLKASFKPFTENTAYCALGSVKSNIGHCLTAAGVAGVIKLLLAIQAKQLPPTINYQQLNEHIRLDNSPFYVNDQLQQWQVASGQARQAMISSFGFGGTNGCAVIAEYQQQSRATVSHDDVVILLSAKTPTALKQQAEQLVDFVQHNQHISLADIAFTLQTGRQMMSERLGFVAATLADVENKLTQFIAGNNKGLYQGQVQSKQDPLVALSKDSDFQDTLDRWISSRKLSKLLEFWAKGLDLDWMRLYQGSYQETPHRIALPSYPFAKTRHWLDDSQLAASAINTTSAAQSSSQAPAQDSDTSGVIHRLVHRNTSDLMQQSYTSLFSAQEPLFAQQQYDDQGQNKGLMSALAYIEVARVALEQAMPEVRRAKGLSLTNLAWIDPMYLTANGQMSKVQMSIVLMANVSEQIDFEIYSQPAKALGVNGAAPAQNSVQNQQEQIHCQGQAQFGAASQPAVVNLNQLQGQMSQAQFAPDALYQGFKHSGLVYGADYQVVKSLALGNNQLLAQLELPQHLAAQAEDYLLHPLLLDGALQAVAAIDGDMNQLSVLSSQSMTAAAVNVFTPTAQLTKVSVWVRRLVAGQSSNASLDIDICDQFGNVVLQILALSSQPEVNWVPTELTDAVTTDLTATQTVTQTVAPVEQTTSTQVMPLAQLQSELTASLADALYLQASDVGLNKPFVELGLDSIVGVEWVAELNKRYGMEIMATKVYDYPNLGELSQFIHAQLDGLLESSPVETMVSAPVVQNVKPVDATDKKSLVELQTELTESLADALYLQASDVTLTKPFVDLGLDSIVGVEWVAELNKRYGMDIMATKVYDYPNLGELSQFIHAQFIDSQLESTPAPASVTASVEHAVVVTEKEPLAGVKKPLAELQTELTESLADALYLQASDVTLTKPFVDLGLDSIVGVEWVAELNKRYGLEIMATKVYDYPNLGELSQFIHAQFIESQLESTPAPASVTAPVEHVVVAIEKKPLAELQTELTESLADALYLQASDVTLTKPFVDLGLDSIVGVEWVAELNKRYGLEIMATKVYDYPNLGELSAFIHGQLQPQASNQVASTSIASAPVAEPVAELGAVHVQAIAVPVTNKGKASPHQQPQRQARTSIRTMGKGKGLRLAQVNFAPKYDAKYTQLALYSPVCKGNFAQDGEIAIELNLSPQSNIGMQEHVVFGEHLLPTDMYLELVYATAITYFDIPAPSMTNITLVNPLLGMAGKTNYVKVIFRANGVHDQLQFLVKSSFSADFADEKLHMQGLLQQQSVSGKLMPKLQSAQSQALSQFKPETDLTGNQIVTNKGRYYAPLSKIACANNGALGYIKVAANEFNFAINPLAIYGALGTVINYGAYQVNKQFPVSNELFLPYSIDKLDVLATLSGNDYYCYAETKNVTANSVELYFELLDASYKPVLVVETIRLIRVAPSTIEQQVQGIKQQLASVPVAVAAATGSALNSSELVQQEVAIIGMACRYPMANDVNQFWDNLVAGKDCVTEVSVDRWQMSEKGDSQWFNPNNNHPHTAYSKWAGFIDDIDVFDPLFFGISPVEAQVMEPQQRLFLEHSWQCIEDAGYAPSSLSKQACGVYVGCAASDYTKVLADAGQDTVGGAFMGTSTAILAARIAYFLNLKGPAVALDTACSSSLTAVHLAAESIRSGQCQSALAGGVNVLATPFGHILTSQVGMLNAEGGCRTFDASAAGIAFSEGCGVIMLKALSQAEQDNDNILGVLRGSGLNQDGKTNGITAPSGNAQEQLLRQIYQRFDINPQDISYIEAHGTGTPLGDPIEVNALASVFNQHQLAQGSCALGSVKSNIGHAGFAAGMASIIKVLLQLKHKQLVPSIHFNRSNPHIDFAKSPFYVNTETREWHSDTLRTAAISSFGFSGTNAHVVIGEYVNQTQQPEAVGQYMVPISAKSKAQLQQAASQLLDFVEREPQVSLSRLAYTLQAGRDAMDYRMAFLVESVTQLQTVLDIVVNGNGKDAAVYQGDVGANRQAMAVFATDEDMQQVISNWQRQRKWTKLIDLWVKGLDIDWHNLYQQAGGHPQRMALPTYPFVKQRIWVEADQAQLNKRQQTNNNTNMIHPLVQQNRSDFATQRFITLLQGHEYWLADHVVDGQKVLPAVAYLEMARAAITQALPEPDIDATLSLHHLAWSQPVVVDDEVELTILLEAQSPEQIEFVVNSNAGEQLHCQGHASLNQASAPIALNIDSLKARTQVATLQGVELYPFFNTMGLDYRNGYQSITQVHLGNSEVLVELELAAGMSDLAQLELHPCMLDSALQGSIVLLAGADLQLSNPILPFALERLDILAPVKAKMFAWVRYSQGASNSEQVIKVDIDLCDIDGNICVQMHGFSSRPLTLKANQAEQDFDDSYYQKVIEQVLNNELSADEAGELE